MAQNNRDLLTYKSWSVNRTAFLLAALRGEVVSLPRFPSFQILPVFLVSWLPSSTFKANNCRSRLFQITPLCSWLFYLPPFLLRTLVILNLDNLEWFLNFKVSQLSTLIPSATLVSLCHVSYHILRSWKLESGYNWGAIILFITSPYIEGSQNLAAFEPDA